MCQAGNKNSCKEQFYCSVTINLTCNKYSTTFWRCVKCTLQFWKAITFRQTFCLLTGITAHDVTYCKIMKHPKQSNSFKIMPCKMYSKTKCQKNLVPKFSHKTEVQFTLPTCSRFNPLWADFTFRIKDYHRSNFQLSSRVPQPYC